MSDKSNKYSFIHLSEKSSRFKKLREFSFVESCTSNANFDKLRNDGMSNIYLAVQNKDMKVSIRSIDVSNDSVVTDTMVMNVSLKDGTDEVTVFGSDLTDDGILWLSAFNVNKIIALDLVKKELIHEFDDIPCPNDLCISMQDPNIIYVAGGSDVDIPKMSLKSSEQKLAVTQQLAVTPVFGQIYAINVKNKTVKNTNINSLATLAGICELNNTIVVSELYAIKAIKTNSFFRRKPVKIWHGTSIGDGEQCYLSDNIKRWDEYRATVSIYRSVSKAEVEVMENRYLSLFGWSCGKAVTCIHNCFTGAPNELNNAELLISFSTGDVFVDVCFMIFDTRNNRPYHFKLDHKKLNIPPHVEFDGHVTHVQHHAGKIIFINFKSNHIMVLDDMEVTGILNSVASTKDIANPVAGGIKDETRLK